MRRLARALTSFFGSAHLALVLLVFIGAWSAVATAIVQGPVGSEAVAVWGKAHTGWEPIVDALNLHQAFTAPIFLAALAMLALSTGVCTWRRTVVALKRWRILSSARSEDAHYVATHADFVVAAPGVSSADALDRVANALGELDIKASRQDRLLRGVSSPWGTMGSAVLHWSLLLLIVAAGLGALTRSEGSVAVPVGSTVRDEKPSYVAVSEGPWFRWSREPYVIRVDALDPALMLKGIDRGAVPEVALLDASGSVVATQQVYANKKLHRGSMSISAPSVGLVVRMSILGPNQQVVSRPLQMVDFSQEASGGTVPLRSLAMRDQSGQVILRLFSTVPLDRSGGGYGEWIPRQPRARVKMADGGGNVLVDSVIGEGESAPIAGGGFIRVDDIDWYSRLVIVHDASIPFIYAAMLLASLGMGISLLLRQQIVQVAAIGDDGSVKVAVRLRLWRNAPASRAEIEAALRDALMAPDERSIA